jgi:hypothetical protein
MHIKKWFLYIFMISVLYFQSLSALASAVVQPVCSECHGIPSEVLKPEHEKVESFSDCLTCHESGTETGSLGDRIHLKHTEAQGATEETCFTCHKPDAEGKIIISSKKQVVFDKADIEDLVEKYATWSDSAELADSHKTAGVGCSACHVNYDYDDYDTVSAKCTGCHGGYEQLAPKTAERHRNPHKSHYGNLNCAKCHQVHEPFADYCDQCHKTNMKWNKKVK